MAGYRIDCPWAFAYVTAAIQRTGAKITVYENETTTKVSLFSDRDCLVAAANPVESVNGYFPVRYVATAALHTMLWEDTDGTDRLSADDIAPFQDSMQANALNQALDAGLTAFAGLTISADKLPYGTGTDTFATTTFTSAARTLLDDTTVGAMCDTLGAFDSGDVATPAQIWADTANKIIDVDGAWDSVEPVALTDAATVAVDFGAGVNFSVTLGGNRTLGQPSNQKVGQSGFIRITQDGTGNRTLAYHNDWYFANGTSPTLSTAAGAIDILFYQVVDANKIYAALAKSLA